MSAEAEQIIGLYRRHAQAWANARGSKLLEKKWLEKFVPLLPARASILDLGCGSGDPIGRYFVQSGYALTGVDSSPELIEIAAKNNPEADCIVADMRKLQLDATFNGILAWNSTFHLTPEDQRLMFPVFAQHASPGAALLFTSGPRHGEAIGEFEGEALYHSSLDGEEYRTLLNRHGFDLIDHVLCDQQCGQHTVWLAQYKAAA